MIKYLDSNKIQEHRQRVGIYESHNRPANAPRVVGYVGLHARGSSHPEFNCCESNCVNERSINNGHNNTGNTITNYNNNCLDKFKLFFYYLLKFLSCANSARMTPRGPSIVTCGSHFSIFPDSLMFYYCIPVTCCALKG